MERDVRLQQFKKEILEAHSKDLKDFWIKMLDLFDNVLTVSNIETAQRRELQKSCRSKILRIGNNKVRQFEEKVDKVFNLKE